MISLEDDLELLQEIANGKLRYQEVGGVEGFTQAIVSGLLGNWLVEMAAFLSVMGRTIIGRFLLVALPFWFAGTRKPLSSKVDSPR